MSNRTMNLQLFADAGTYVNTTTQGINAYTGEGTPFNPATGNDLSVGNKTFYDTALLENTRAQLVYDQLGEDQVVPAHKGTTVEFRKFNTIAPPDRLVEGQIPTGKSFGETAIVASVAEFGEYVALTEELKTNQIDNVALAASEEIGASMGLHKDTLTRNEVMAQATNVVYAEAVDASGAVVAAPSHVYEVTNAASARSFITPRTIAMAKTGLVKAGGKKFGNDYVAVIHPSVAFDLMTDPNWESFHKYAATTEIFAGELGKLYGVRFVESTNAPVLVGKSLFNESQRWLTLASTNPYQTLDTAGTIASGSGYGVGSLYRFAVTEDLDGAAATADYAAYVGQYVLFYDGDVLQDRLQVVGVDTASNYVYTASAPTSTPASGDTLVPGNGGREAKKSTEAVAVYATMVFSQGAFKKIKIAGGEMRTIIKPAAEVGGPLEQFSTIGSKYKHGVKVVYPEKIVTIYSASTFSGVDAANWAVS